MLDKGKWWKQIKINGKAKTDKTRKKTKIEKGMWL